MAEPSKIIKRNWLLRLRPVMRWAVKLRSSPRAIAGGLAVGVFVAFTPTVGLQIILAIIAATICDVNRPAAIVPVWITNPVTVGPVYTFNYWLGSMIWPGPPLSEVSHVFAEIGRALTRLDFWDLEEQVMTMVRMSREILIPLTIGSVVVGLVLGLLTYFLSMKLLSFFFHRRAQRQLLNNRRERRKKPRN